MDISGKLLRDAIISGANSIQNNKKSVDELNVFPVPDGDTGTNMSMTIGNAVSELRRLPDDVSAGEVAKVAASAMLRGARGNSGVILSLLFRGFSKGLADKETATAKDIADSFVIGVDAAYKSVMKPTEGTILTVARVASERFSELAENESDLKLLWSDYVQAADAALQTTPELLPVLKKAGVVDAGGMGYLTIIRGMNEVISGGKVIESVAAAEKPHPIITNAAGSLTDAEIVFGYCTEFIVQKDKNAKSAAALRAFLESIGDSVVVVDDDDIIKVHVHTNHPGNAMEEGLKFGALTKMKIENMREQHTHQMEEVELQKQQILPPAEPEKDFGFVTVCAGDGVEELFRDLGADVIVRGGQTMNPSTDDILQAINAVPARNIFVLPNNKNIILAAEQAVNLTDRNVIVLQTRSIPQGISAMLAFQEDMDVQANSVAMTAALDKVGSGQLTFAARDSEYEGYQIREGEILALENGKLTFIDHDVTKALVKLVRKLVKPHTSFVTLLYGEGITEEEAQAAYDILRTKLNENISIVLVNGGQPVYYYIVSVE